MAGAANEAVGLFFAPLLAEFSTVPSGRMALVATTLMIGNAVGFLFAGPLGDKHGRRFLARMGAVGALGASALTLWTPSFPSLLLARSIFGMSLGLLTVAVPTLISEGIPASRRETVLAVYPCGWPLGALPCLAYASQPWRHALGGAPLLLCLPLLALLVWLPESPQFLSAKGRSKEAAKAFKRFGMQAPSATPSDATQQGSSDREAASPKTDVSLSFWRLAAAFMLRHAASATVKVWLPVFVGGAQSNSSSAAGTVMMMYALEVVGILGTAGAVGLASRRQQATAASGTSRAGKGGPLAVGTRVSLALGSAATLGCLLCRGDLAVVGLLGGLHLVAQANAFNLLSALVVSIVPTEERARIFSRLNLLGYMVGGLSPLLLGLLVGSAGASFHGVGRVLVVAAILYGIAAVVSPMPFVRARAREPEPPRLRAAA